MESHTISLKYEGKALEYGQMHLEDVVKILSGFYESYDRIAQIVDPKNESDSILELKAIQTDSFEFILELKKLVLSLFATGPPMIYYYLNILWIIKQLKGYPEKIEKSQDHNNTLNIEGSNNQVVFSQDPKNSSITIKGNDNQIIIINDQPIDPNSLAQLCTDNKLHQKINKMIQPLEKGKIDQFTFSYQKATKQVSEHKVTIEVDQKNYFIKPKELENKTQESKPTNQETQFIGTIRALDKKNNEGKFIAQGKTLKMKLMMKNPEKYYSFFEKPLLEVAGTLYFNSDLEAFKIEVFDIQNLPHTQHQV